MKNIFFLFSAFFFLNACKSPSDQPSSFTQISKRISFREGKDFFELKSGNYTYEIPAGKLPFKRIIMLNSSLCGYVSEINAEDNIVGVTSPEYIYSGKILDGLKLGKVQNIGNEQKYDVEKILAIKPDAIFTNHIATFENTYDLLKKNGIQIIFIDEYLEENPLEKSKIVEVFGKLLGKTAFAEERYDFIKKRYDSLKILTMKIPQKPTVLSNEMYGNQWFMPGGRSCAARYISDAGGNYILKGNSDEKAVPMSFEEVFAKAGNATVWVAAGSHNSKSELLAVNPNYAKMNVFKNGRIYAENGRTSGMANDFFISGVVRADLVLQDYVKIFHTDMLPQKHLIYMKELR